MADNVTYKNVSELEEATELSDEMVFLVSDNGEAKKVSGSTMKNYVSSVIDNAIGANY